MASPHHFKNCYMWWNVHTVFWSSNTSRKQSMGLRRWCHADNKEKIISNEKINAYHFLGKYGIGQSHKLVEQKRVTTNWYATKCLPEILQEMNVRGLKLHHDNASTHSARLIV